MPEIAGHVFGIPLNDVLVAASGATGIFFFFFGCNLFFPPQVEKTCSLFLCGMRSKESDWFIHFFFFLGSPEMRKPITSGVLL